MAFVDRALLRFFSIISLVLAFIALLVTMGYFVKFGTVPFGNDSYAHWSVLCKNNRTLTKEVEKGCNELEKRVATGAVGVAICVFQIVLSIICISLVTNDNGSLIYASIHSCLSICWLIAFVLSCHFIPRYSRLEGDTPGGFPLVVSSLFSEEDQEAAIGAVGDYLFNFIYCLASATVTWSLYWQMATANSYYNGSVAQGGYGDQGGYSMNMPPPQYGTSPTASDAGNYPPIGSSGVVYPTNTYPPPSNNYPYPPGLSPNNNYYYPQPQPPSSS